MIRGRVFGRRLQSHGQPVLEYEKICNSGMDVVQDLIDGFGTTPRMGIRATTDRGGDMLDIFGGMIYELEPSGLRVLRRINEKAAAARQTSYS